MQISSAQCRAARSLISWTQEQLAENAGVSRATIADFESNTRQPMKNNIRSIADCLFAAGVDFIPEEGKLGVGVRFRDRKLEYRSNVDIDLSRGRATMPMRFSGSDFRCIISREAVDDLHGANFQTEADFRQAVSEKLHIILAAAERFADTKILNGEMLITSEMLSEIK